MSENYLQWATEFPSARILLVEDLLISQELTRRTLEAIGHRVDTVADGAAAVAAVQTSSYDLVLMDVQMPVMDGVAATQSIRALAGPAQNVPIVALTSHTHPTDIARFGPAGMDSYLAKPYSDMDLYGMVELWQSEGAQRQAALPAVPARPALDPDIFQNVERMVGADRVHALLGLLRKAFCETIPIEAVDEAEQAAARFKLHALVSQAGQMGFVELSKAARALETAIGDGNATDAGMKEFVSARAAAVAELDRRIAA